MPSSRGAIAFYLRAFHPGSWPGAAAVAALCANLRSTKTKNLGQPASEQLMHMKFVYMCIDCDPFRFLELAAQLKVLKNYQSGLQYVLCL